MYKLKKVYKETDERKDVGSASDANVEVKYI